MNDRQGGDEAAARLVEGILRRKSFYFQQRSGKLDMRAIGRVDIETVVKDVDIDTLQVSLTETWCIRVVGAGRCLEHGIELRLARKGSASLFPRPLQRWLHSCKMDRLLARVATYACAA